MAEDYQIGPDPSLLLVDDDEIFLNRLARAMEKRGFSVARAVSVAEARTAVAEHPPAYAVVDLRLEDGNGLDVVDALREARADARIVVLTGYGAIATAVAAVKMGATDYLSKPADADDVTHALLARGETLPLRPKRRCRPTGYAGNISSASMSNATAMSVKRRAACICTGGLSSGFWPNAARVNNPVLKKDCNPYWNANSENTYCQNQG